MAPLMWFDARASLAGSNQCVNTWHVANAGSGFNATDANNVLAAVKPFYDVWATYRTTGIAFTIGSRVLIQDTLNWIKPTFDSQGKLLTKGRWSSPPTILGATPVTSTVGSGGSALPYQLANVMSWKTANAGRSARGRTYLGALAQAGQSGALVLGAFVSMMNTACASLITAVKAVSLSGGGNPYLACWSPTRGEVREILTGSNDGTYDTMRSRQK